MKIKQFLGLGIFLISALVFSLNFINCSNGSTSGNGDDNSDVTPGSLKAVMEIVAYPKIRFNEGEAFSYDGLQLKVTYTGNRTPKTVSSNNSSMTVSVEGLDIPELQSMPVGVFQVIAKYTESGKSAAAKYRIYVGGAIYGPGTVLTHLDFEVQKPLNYTVGSSSVSDDILVMGYNESDRFFFDGSAIPYEIQVGTKEPGNPTFTTGDFSNVRYKISLKMKDDATINNSNITYEDDQKVGVFPILLVDVEANKKVGLTTEEANNYLAAPAFYRAGTPYAKVILVGKDGGGTYDTTPPIKGGPDTGDETDQTVWVLSDAGTAYTANNDDLTNYELTQDHINNGTIFYKSTRSYALNTQDQLKDITNNDDKFYFITTDIDLVAINWVAPTNFKGRLYGNDKTIRNLELTKTNGDTALFQTTGPGAGIYDLTIEAKTPSGGLIMTQNAHFGGVIGTAAGAAVLKNVRITGNLHYAGQSANNLWLVVGGLIAEVYNPGNITIEECVSDINIYANLDNKSHSTNETDFTAGGFIGKIHQSITETVIKNSYAGGSITLIGGNGNTAAGGFVGVLGVTNNNSNRYKIENSYSAGRISVTATGASGKRVSAGSFVGDHLCGTLTMSNNAALNPSILVLAGATSYNNRLIGRNNTPSTYTNNFALKTMLLGSGSGAEKTSADANSIDGLDKTVDDFKTETTWTNAAGADGLGWSDTYWDFTNIATDYHPLLKSMPLN